MVRTGVAVERVSLGGNREAACLTPGLSLTNGVCWQ